jgi:hypothetical protein
VVKEIGVGGIEWEVEWKMSNSSDGRVERDSSSVGAEWGEMPRLA